MGVRIGISRAARWEDLGFGVRVLMRPGTSVEIEAAGGAARDRVRAALSGGEALRDLGLDAPGAARLDDLHFVLGLTRWLIAAELAALLVEDWQGVEDEATGQPAALSPAALADLLRYEPIERAFEERAYAVVLAGAAEGKGSPPPPNGSAAEAANTAPVAASSEAPAPAAPENVP